MRLNILAIMSLLFLFYSCEEIKKKSFEQEYTELYTRELKSGKILNDLFLGFKFGKTKKEVMKKIDALLKQKILYINNDREYEYNFQFDTSSVFSKAKINLQFDYYRDSLYCLTLIGTPDEDFASEQTCQIDMYRIRDIYAIKYGKYDWLSKDDIENKYIEKFVKIIGNCEIAIYPIRNHFFISYTDLPKGKLAEKEENDKNNKMLEKSIGDI